MRFAGNVLVILLFIGVSGPAGARALLVDNGGTAEQPAFEQPAAPAPEAGSAMPEPGSPVQSKLEELVATRLGQFITRKPEREAVEAFYRARGFAPLWSTDGNALPRARAAIDYLSKVAAEGLDPRDYAVPQMADGMNEEDAASNDLKLTRAVLTYARHASAGRVSFSRVSGAILYRSHAVDPAQALEQISAAGDVTAELASFEPQHQAFKALQAQLAKALAAAAPGAPSPPRDSKKNRNATAGRGHVVDTLIANMERWRWLPRDLGRDYVMVNIPDYTLSVIDDGRPIWRSKIVVGKPGAMATPLLSEPMKYLTVNPTWNVPPSIIRNEYLPALERDPDALERIGLKVGHNRDGSLRVYQPPGERNALGHIRFNFPNPFLVYQHDTPNKELFARATRALSHGCMRVQNPEQYAVVLLSLSQPNEKFTIARIKSLYGNQEHTINLRTPIPVHVTYQTAFVDGEGHLNMRSDVYGLDAAVLKLMRGDQRGIADVPIARNYNSSSKPVVARLPAHPEREKNETNGFNGSDFDHAALRAYANDPSSRPVYDRAVGNW
jgi:murein L,D-transpeptidase YcbB/YkuD